MTDPRYPLCLSRCPLAKDLGQFVRCERVLVECPGRPSYKSVHLTVQLASDRYIPGNFSAWPQQKCSYWVKWVLLHRFLVGQAYPEDKVARSMLYLLICKASPKKVIFGQNPNLFFRSSTFKLGDKFAPLASGCNLFHPFLIYPGTTVVQYRASFPQFVEHMDVPGRFRHAPRAVLRN